MKRIFKYALIAAAALSLQSCLFEQQDFFDKSSSVRLNELMVKTQETLVASSEGWLMEMYPEATQTYGGYAYILKFDKDQQVTVWAELASKASDSITSLYKITAEDGACLVFDSYNEHLHFFSTPSQSAYQAYQGEFEFAICNVTNDLITLRGCKTGNIMYLRKFTGDPEAYLNKIAEEEELILMSGFKGSLGGKEVVSEIDIDNRQISVTSGDQTSNVAYAVTPEGIRLYKSIEVGTSDFSALAINASGEITVNEGSAKGTTLKATYPEGYRRYEEYAGKYEFTFALDAQSKMGSFPVELKPVGDGLTYIMTGVAGWDASGNYDPDKDMYDVVLSYSKSKGNLSMLCQNFKKDGEYVLVDGRYVGITPCASSKDGGTSGYLSYASNVGVMTKWNGDETNPEYTWINNGNFSGRSVDTFWLCTYSGPTQTSATRKSGSSLPKEYLFFGKTNIMWKPTTLKKIN